MSAGTLTREAAVKHELSILLAATLVACDGEPAVADARQAHSAASNKQPSDVEPRAPQKRAPEKREVDTKSPPAGSGASTSAALAPASPASARDDSGALEILFGGKLRKPSSIRPSTEPGMTDEPHEFGWSATTGEFKYCVQSGGADCGRCRYYDPGRDAVETLEFGSECARPSRPSELKARRASGKFVVQDGSWAYGAEVLLVVSEGQGAPDTTGIERGFVRVGARLRPEGSKTGWNEREVSCSKERGERYCAPDVHLDAVAPSPDGAHVAVLTHSFAGEYSDRYSVTIYDAASLAAKAYNAEGLARLKAEQYPRAAALFERVAALDPKAWKGPYNLACVHARAGEKAGARAALEEAIRRGGEPVREKLARDRDLDNVRGEPWFAAL